MYSKGIIYKIVCNLNDVVYIGSTFNELRHRWSNHKGHFKFWLEGKGGCVSIFPYFKEFGIENFSIIKIKEYIVYRENNKDRRHLSVYEQLWINKTRCINKINASIFLSQTHYSKLYDKERYIKNKETILAKNKEYRDTNRDKILAYSKEFRNTNRETISAYKKERYIKNKETILAQCKEYRDTNKETISAKMKEYRNKNKETISAKMKEYRDKNKETILAHQKEHYLKNKDKILSKSKEYQIVNKDKIRAQQKVKHTCKCGSNYIQVNKKRHFKTQKHKKYVASLS
ncbi:hypothetical protein N9Q05_01565 [bacterium]|nr:hypothetical protein [bacterium]